MVQGYFDLRFEAVRDLFADLFEDGRPGGAALCVRIGGETVLDLWGGSQDRAGDVVWEQDTLVNLFSCTKAFTAVAALQLVAEGRLSLDEPVARVWPAFAAAGKGAITLRQVLCHRAGVPALGPALPAEALFDWARMTAALAAEAPWWTPGTCQGYAPMTYGWLLGELIHRVEGREPGAAIVARVAEPLGLDFHLGLEASAQARVAWLERGRNDFGDAIARQLMEALQRAPEALPARAFNNPPGLLGNGNRPEWRGIAQPAANGHGNARSLAGFYEGLLAGRLLDEALLAEMCREHSAERDLTLLAPTRFGLGCWLDQPATEGAGFGMGPRAFGHPGAGGCLGFADPERELAFGFVTRIQGPYVLIDPRALALSRAVRACLG